MRGAFANLDYSQPPSDMPALAVAASAVAASPAAKASMVKAGSKGHLRGAYLRLRGEGDTPPPAAPPFYQPLVDWVTANPALAAGVAIGGGLLLSMGGKRR